MYPPPKPSLALTLAKLDRVCVCRCCSRYCFCFHARSSTAIFSCRTRSRPSSVMNPTCLVLPMGTSDVPAGCCIRNWRNMCALLRMLYNLDAASHTGYPLSTEPPRIFIIVAVAIVPSYLMIIRTGTAGSSTLPTAVEYLFQELIPSTPVSKTLASPPCEFTTYVLTKQLLLEVAQNYHCTQTDTTHTSLCVYI